MVNHVGGNRHHIASNHNNMELQQRGTRQTNATAGVDGAGEARREEISRIAHLLENYFPGGEEIRDILHQQATELHDEIGHTADDVKATIAKGDKLDMITSSLVSGAGALGYALSGVPGDLIGKGIAQHLGLPAGTPMHDFVTGMAGGVTAVGFKAVLEEVLTDSAKDTKWMQADSEKLEPFMQDVMKKRDSALHKIGQAGMGGLGFDARNVVTGGLSAGIQTLKENDPRNNPVGILAGARKPGYVVNQSVSTVLTVAAGSMSGVVQNKYNKLHGPEFLFGRTDWKERYKALADTSVSGQLINGVKNRVTTAAKDAASLEKWGAGLSNLITINQLSEMLALGAGLGGTNIAKSAAREGVMTAAIGNMPTSPEDLLTNPAFRALREGAAQAANLPTAAVAYFGQGLAGLGSSAAMSAFSHLRQSPADNTSETSSGATNTENDSHSSAITGQDIPLPASGNSSPASTSRPASRASSAITGQDIPLPASGNSSPASTSRPASRASSAITGQDIPLPASGNSSPASTSRPASRASSAITGQDIPLPASGDSSPASTSRPASRASSAITGQDIPLPASGNSSPASTSRPASRASSAITGQDIPLPASGDSSPASTSRPASRASSAITGQDIPLPASGNSSPASTSRPASSHSNAPSLSRNDMQAQQMADRIGKM